MDTAARRHLTHRRCKSYSLTGQKKAMPPFQDTLFPITFWAPPPPEIEHYRKMAAGGFTVAQVSAETPQAGRKALDLAQQVGIQAIVWDPRIYRELPERPHWEDVVRAVIHDYADHPALYGYMLADEPHPREFDNLARLVRAFQSLDPNHVPYVNMLPGWVKSEWLGTLDYRQHVQRYMEISNRLCCPTTTIPCWKPTTGQNGSRTWRSCARRLCGRACRSGSLFWRRHTSSTAIPCPPSYAGRPFAAWPTEPKGYLIGLIGRPMARTIATASATILATMAANTSRAWAKPGDLKLAPSFTSASTAVYHWPDIPGEPRYSLARLVQSIEGGSVCHWRVVDEQKRPWLMV